MKTLYRYSSILIGLSLFLTPISSKACVTADECNTELKATLIQLIQVLQQQLADMIAIVQANQNQLQINQDNLMTKVDKISENTTPKVFGSVITDQTEIVVNSTNTEVQNDYYLIKINLSLKNYNGDLVNVTQNHAPIFSLSVTKNGENINSEKSAFISDKLSKNIDFTLRVKEIGNYEILISSEPYKITKTQQILVQ